MTRYENTMALLAVAGIGLAVVDIYFSVKTYRLIRKSLDAKGELPAEEKPATGDSAGAGDGSGGAPAGGAKTNGKAEKGAPS